jgi:hypothetical protein
MRMINDFLCHKSIVCVIFTSAPPRTRSWPPPAAASKSDPYSEPSKQVGFALKSLVCAASSPHSKPLKVVGFMAVVISRKLVKCHLLTCLWTDDMPDFPTCGWQHACLSLRSLVSILGVGYGVRIMVKQEETGVTSISSD